jgi:hypothetical protein
MISSFSSPLLIKRKMAYILVIKDTLSIPKNQSIFLLDVESINYS